MANRTEVYLIRHGEAQNNVRKNYIAGRSNEFPLTDQGVEQSQRLGGILLEKGIIPDRVVSSPAERAKQTGRTALIAMSLEHMPILEDDRLQEQETGEWTGKVATDIFTEATLARITELGKEFRSPGGESFNDVGLRMREWIDTVAENERTFAFTHGGAIRCLPSQIYDWTHEQTYKTQPDNTSVSLWVRDGDGWKLEYLGKDAAELEETHG